MTSGLFRLASPNQQPANKRTCMRGRGGKGFFTPKCAINRLAGIFLGPNAGQSGCAPGLIGSGGVLFTPHVADLHSACGFNKFSVTS